MGLDIWANLLSSESLFNKELLPRMKLLSLTEKQLRSFAGDVIYERGEAYFHEGSVREFDYDANAQRIEATVEGNYDNYLVDIQDGDEFSATCDCPYDGYPCKHIVAVLLRFIEERGRLSTNTPESSSKTAKKAAFSLKKSLMNLEREDLADIILAEAAKNKELRLRLEMRFRGADTALVNQLKQQINDYFPHTERGTQHFNAGQVTRAIRKLIKSFEAMPPDAQVELHWHTIDCALYPLSEFRMQSAPVESLIMDELNLLLALMKEHDFPELRRRIIESLLYYYGKSMSYIHTELLDAATLLARTKSDYALIISGFDSSSQGLHTTYVNQKMESLRNLQAGAAD